MSISITTSLMERCDAADLHRLFAGLFDTKTKASDEGGCEVREPEKMPVPLGPASLAQKGNAS